MAPAQRLGDGPRRAAGLVEPPVAGIGVGLQDAREAPKMLDRMIARTVPRVAEQSCRRVRARERRIVAHIDPGPPGGALALGQHRHRRVVAVQAFCRQHVGLDQRVQRLQRRGARTHLVGQRRGAEIDPFAGVAIPLPVQRLVLPVLLEQDRRQQVGTRPAARRRVERRRRLGDGLAIPAAELLPHRLDHLPAARDHLKRLRHVLADLRQPLRPAAHAGRGSRHYHPFARQMFGEGLAPRLATDEPLDLGRCCRRPLGREIVLAGVGRQIVEGKLKLIEQALLALRPLPVKCAAELLDHHLQGSDLRLSCRHPRLRCRKRCLKCSNVVSGRAGHGAGSESDSSPSGNC